MGSVQDVSTLRAFSGFGVLRSWSCLGLGVKGCLGLGVAERDSGSRVWGYVGSRLGVAEGLLGLGNFRVWDFTIEHLGLLIQTWELGLEAV